MCFPAERGVRLVDADDHKGLRAAARRNYARNLGGRILGGDVTP
jgi:hypothetical protein